MARRLRLQFPGATYHVFNRGRDGRRVFGTTARAQAFLQVLDEVATAREWRVHAYTLLPDGFHLVVETPRGNLAEGMRNLQGTFATRLSRSGGEGGSQFHGRYRSILLEPGEVQRRAIEQVHALPVQRGLVSWAQLPQFRWSSRRWLERGDAPTWWAHRTEPAGAPGPESSPAPMPVDRGWIAGSPGWMADRRSDYETFAVNPAAVEARGRTEREAAWGRRLDDLLATAGRSRAEAAATRKAAPWKVELAVRLRRETDATLAWIARELVMGAPGGVSRYVAEWQTGRRRAERVPAPTVAG